MLLQYAIKWLNCCYTFAILVKWFYHWTLHWTRIQKDITKFILTAPFDHKQNIFLQIYNNNYIELN